MNKSVDIFFSALFIVLLTVWIGAASVTDAFAADIPKTVERPGTVSCPRCEPLVGELERIRRMTGLRNVMINGDGFSVSLSHRLRLLKKEYGDYEVRLGELNKLPAQPTAHEQKRLDDEIAKIEEKMSAGSKGISRLEEEINTLNMEIRDLRSREKALLGILEECRMSCSEKPPKPLAPHPVENNCPKCSRIVDDISLALAEIDSLDERISGLGKEFQARQDTLSDLRGKEAELTGIKGLEGSSSGYREFLQEHMKVLAGVFEARVSEIKEKLKRLSEEQMQASIRADELKRQLYDCQDSCREKPKKTACSDVPFKPVQIGPQSQYGSGFAKSAGDTAKKVAGGLLGGFVKGPVSIGGGGNSEEPRLASNPFKEMKTFSDPDTGTTIKLAGRQTDQGLLIAGGIEKGDGKPTFHSMTLHRDDCEIIVPDEYFLYELWLNWSLHVSWTRTTYQDGRVVSSEHGEWSKSGSELLDRGVFSSNRGGEGSMWRQFGFDRATEGAQQAGALFKADNKGNSILRPGDRLIVHVTQPDKDPVRTLPFVFNILKNPDGTINFEKTDAQQAAK